MVIPYTYLQYFSNTCIKKLGPVSVRTQELVKYWAQSVLDTGTSRQGLYYKSCLFDRGHGD